LKDVDFSNSRIKTLSRGYGASNELAQDVIDRINKKLGAKI
jgi:hypothetical protein